MVGRRSPLPINLPVNVIQVPRSRRGGFGDCPYPRSGGESELSSKHERAGPDPSPTPSSKVAPLKHSLGVYHPITLVTALVGRLGERKCHPKPFEWGEVTVWLAQCPLDDPTSMASCGALTVREGVDGEALVTSNCPHPLAETICDVLGIFPDDPRLLGEAYGNSRKNPQPQNQGEVAR